MLNKGAFSVEVTVRDGIVIKREQASLQLSAAEVDTFLSALLTVMRIESYPLLPGSLSVPPFIIRFFENRTMEIVRNNNEPKGSGLPFRFDEGDDLIWLGQQARATYIESSNKPLKGLKSPSVPDPIG